MLFFLFVEVLFSGGFTRVPNIVCKITKCLTFAQHLPSCAHLAKRFTAMKSKWIKWSPPASTQISQKPPEKEKFGLFSNLQFWEPLYGLQRPEHAQDSQGLDGVDVLAFGSSAGEKRAQEQQRESFAPQVTLWEVCGCPGWLWWWNCLGLGMF